MDPRNCASIYVIAQLIASWLSKGPSPEGVHWGIGDFSGHDADFDPESYRSSQPPDGEVADPWAALD
jgi:hypothetical protein